MKQINLIYGSEHGNTEHLAYAITEHLQQLGYAIQLFDDPYACDLTYLTQNDVLLIMTSTTGAGDIPENLADWCVHIDESKPNLNQLEALVIAIGDSNYAETFCGAGHQVYEILEARGVRWLQPLYQVDMSETAAPKIQIIDWMTSWLSK